MIARHRAVAASAVLGLVASTTACLQEGNTSTVTIIETTPTDAPLPTLPTAPTESAPTESAESQVDDKGGPPKVVATIATGLQVPWGIAFLPDGDALVTERDTARLLLLTGPDHEVREIATLEEAAPEGEGGLLGVAVSPTYSEDQHVFLYVTATDDNRVLRGRFDGSSLLDVEPILTGIPRSYVHDGGQLAFGPDGYLYVSTGDALEPDRAPDLDDLAGKVLRITADGDPAPDNPDPDSPVWTSGHRNVQGLAFAGNHLWATEFGADSSDELNLLRPGRDYGWPAFEGTGGRREGYADPELTWSTEEASPSGLAYLDDRLWFGALRGVRLWRVEVSRKSASRPKSYFIGEYGRLRGVVAAPDGTLWVATSNTDGRGVPADGDDRILQIRP